MGPAALALALAPAVAEGQGPEGCYTVRLGAWTPEPTSAQAPFLVLPERLRLTRDLGTTGPESGRSLVRPRQDLGERVSWAFWRMEDMMEVIFINDFGSIHLKLYPREWGWIGDALAVSEPARSARASVWLRRTSCSTPGPEEAPDHG